MSDYSSTVIIDEFKSNASTNMTTFLSSQTATELFPVYRAIGSNVATKWAEEIIKHVLPE